MTVNSKAEQDFITRALFSSDTTDAILNLTAKDLKTLFYWAHISIEATADYQRTFGTHAPSNDEAKVMAEKIGCKCVDRVKYQWQTCPIHKGIPEPAPYKLPAAEKMRR